MRQKPEVGMLTPEGSVQSVRAVSSGVYRVDTGAHGFLVLSWILAQRLLSPQACVIGERRGQWLFFEEDCAIAAPLFEHPGWSSEACFNPEETLRRYFPGYFAVPLQLGLFVV